MVANTYFGVSASTASVSSGYVLTYVSSTVPQFLAPTAASSGGSGTPGGADTQIQYNSSSTFAGSSNLTFGTSIGVLNYLSEGVYQTVTIGNVGTPGYPNIAHAPPGSTGGTISSAPGPFPVLINHLTSASTTGFQSDLVVYGGYTNASSVNWSIYSIDLEPVVNVGSTGSVANLSGAFISPQNYGNIFGSIEGLLIYPYQYSDTADVSRLSGLDVYVSILGSASAAEVAGITIDGFGGTDNQEVYGLFIGDLPTNLPSGAGSINNNILSEGSSSKNVFRGIVYTGREPRFTLVNTNVALDPYFSSDIGANYDNIGSSSPITISLPSQFASGLHYGFSCLSSQAGITISATAGGDQIALGTALSTGGRISSTVMYSYVELEFVSATLWVGKNLTGTWEVT